MWAVCFNKQLWHDPIIRDMSHSQVIMLDVSCIFQQTTVTWLNHMWHD